MSLEIILLSFANIKIGEKYYISENKSYCQNSLSFFYRKFYNEDRYKTLEYISNILSVYNLSDKKLYVKALEGIKNLVLTYDDSEMKYKLELIISEAELRLINFKDEQEELNEREDIKEEKDGMSEEIIKEKDKLSLFEERKYIAKNPPDYLLTEKKKLCIVQKEKIKDYFKLQKSPINENFCNLMNNQRF